MRNPVRGLVAAGLLLTAAVTSSFNSACAEDCPGNPDALGTSRVWPLTRMSILTSVLWTMRRRYRSLTRKW